MVHAVENTPIKSFTKENLGKNVYLYDPKACLSRLGFVHALARLTTTENSVSMKPVRYISTIGRKAARCVLMPLTC